MPPRDYRQPPLPDCRALARLAAISKNDRLRAGIALAQLFRDNGITSHCVQIGSKIEAPVPSPPFPANLLTEGGLVHVLFDKLMIDINEVRVGPRPRTPAGQASSDSEISFAVLVGLIESAQDVVDEVKRSAAEHRRPRVVFSSGSPAPQIHAAVGKSKVVLGYSSYPAATKAIVDRFSSLPLTLTTSKRTQDVRKIYDALQGIPVKIWEVEGVDTAELYIDLTAEYKRKDLSVAIIKRLARTLRPDSAYSRAATDVEPYAKTPADINFWEVLGLPTFKSHRLKVLDLRRWPTSADVDPSWLKITGAALSPSSDGESDDEAPPSKRKRQCTSSS